MPTTFKKLDVRPLIAQGMEPLSAILSKINLIRRGEGLTVIAPFLPSPLIEKLSSEGFRSRVQHQPDGAWAVNFWRDE
jgi:uncharacterized protein (DUF2249 family)